MEVEEEEEDEEEEEEAPALALRFIFGGERKSMTSPAPPFFTGIGESVRSMIKAGSDMTTFFALIVICFKNEVSDRATKLQLNTVS